MGAAAAGPVLEAHGGGEPAAVRAARGLPGRGGRRVADARPDAAARSRRRPGGRAVRRQPAEGEHRDRARLRSAGAPARRAERRARPAPARAPVGVHPRPRPAGHDGRVLDAQRAGGGALRATGRGAGGWRAAVRGLAGRARAAGRGRPPHARLRSRVRALPSLARTLTVRWLLLKDLRILRRSPLLVGMLIVYPIVIAALVGFALTSGPSKPRVAFVNEIPPGSGKVSLGGQD